MNFLLLLFLVSNTTLSLDKHSPQKLERKLERRFIASKQLVTKVLLPSNSHHRHPLREEKKIFSHRHTVYVRFCRGCFVTVLIHSGRCGRVCLQWVLYDGRRGVTLAHTEPWARIRMGGRKKRRQRCGKEEEEEV